MPFKPLPCSVVVRVLLHFGFTRSIQQADGSHEKTMMGRWRNDSYFGKPTYWSHVGRLIGHLCAAAIVFVALICFGWLVWVLFSFLQSIHPFPGEVEWLLKKAELAVVYLDVAITLLFIGLGVLRFARDLLDGGE